MIVELLSNYIVGFEFVEKIVLLVIGSPIVSFDILTSIYHNI